MASKRRYCLHCALLHCTSLTCTYTGVVEQFLFELSQHSEQAAHELLWVLETEGTPPPPESKLFSVRCVVVSVVCLCFLPRSDAVVMQATSVEFAARCTTLRNRIVKIDPDTSAVPADWNTENKTSNHSRLSVCRYVTEFTFFDSITDIAGKLKQLEKPQRKQRIMQGTHAWLASFYASSH